MRRVPAQPDHDARHLSSLDHEQWALAIRVDGVDVASLRDEVPQDVDVRPRRRRVQRRVRVLVLGRGRNTCSGQLVRRRKQCSRTGIDERLHTRQVALRCGRPNVRHFWCEEERRDGAIQGGTVGHSLFAVRGDV